MLSALKSTLEILKLCNMTQVLKVGQEVEKQRYFVKKKMHEFAALQSFEVNKLGNSNVLKNTVNQRAQARFY